MRAPRVLIECGQHWERAAADVALDTLLRFLGHSGVLAEAFVDAGLQRIARRLPAQQQLVRVTEAVVARSLDFRFVREFRGLEVIAPGRRADRHRWRARVPRALRQHRAGDAGHDAT